MLDMLDMLPTQVGLRVVYFSCQAVNSEYVAVTGY